MWTCLLPLIVSLTLHRWARYTGVTPSFPLSTAADRALRLATFSCVALTILVSGSMTVLPAAILYVVLAAGSAALLIRRGSVECGCWGDTDSRLSWRLVTVDGCFAIATIVTAVGGGFEPLAIRPFSDVGAGAVTVTGLSWLTILAVVHLPITIGLSRETGHHKAFAAEYFLRQANMASKAL